MICGTVSAYNRERGFGFIRRDDGQRDVFVHINCVVSDVEELKIGDRVTFDVANDNQRGKLRAVGVKLIEE